MTDFNPGPGWREVDKAPQLGPWIQSYDENGIRRLWVHEEPVPPLPTSPWSSIRVTWKEDSTASVLTLTGAGTWMLISDDERWLPDDLLGLITGFEILSEPRAVTAKAVLEWIHKNSTPQGEWRDLFMNLAREFGVES